MKCGDLMKSLGDYVDGSADPRICAEFENHLAGCNPCQVVIDTLRKTITLYRNGEPYELPPGFHDKLHACLREKFLHPGQR